MNAVLLVLIALFIPPLAVFLIAGCGADLLINLCLTLLGVIPGHIHAFYLIYVYDSRRKDPSRGPAGGVYSQKVQSGGRGYAAATGPGTIKQGQYVQ